MPKIPIGRSLRRSYGELLKQTPSPIVELNRAVAIAMADGPLRGLALLKEFEKRADLAQYFPYHVARADLLRRAGQTAAAREAYRTALSLYQNRPQQEFLHRCLAELSQASINAPLSLDSADTPAPRPALQDSQGSTCAAMCPPAR